MANYAKRPQPYRVQWPLTPTQAENIDQMFEILFKRIAQTQQAASDAAASASTAVATVANLTADIGRGDEDRLGYFGHAEGANVITRLVVSGVVAGGQNSGDQLLFYGSLNAVGNAEAFKWFVNGNPATTALMSLFATGTLCVASGTAPVATSLGSGGVFLSAVHNTASGGVQCASNAVASGTDIGYVDFGTFGTASAEKRVGAIHGFLTAASGVSPTGELRFYTTAAGAIAEGLALTSAGKLRFNSTRSLLYSTADAFFTFANNADSSGFGLQMGTADTMVVANKAQNAFGAVSALTLQANRSALAAVSTDGAMLVNATAATGAVLVQMSPRLRLSGTAWNGASSDTIDAYWELLPQSGTTRGQIKLGMARNGASAFYPVTIDGNPTTALANMTLAGNGVYRSSGDGTSSSPTFGWVNSGGGSAIGFYTPAANDLSLVCGAANQILWGVGLWRNSAALAVAWSSASDPNSAVGDTAMARSAAAKIKFYNKPESTPDAGFVLDFSVDTVAGFRNRADSAYAQVHCLELKTENATFLHRTGIALTNNAAAAVGTLNNAPAAGNPTKWIAIDDNGTTRYIPAW